MTLTEMASSVSNHVTDGLSGVTSVTLPIDQLKDEILLTTSAIIVKLAAQGVLDIKKLSQRIDGIRVECKDLSANCSVESNVGAPHFTIPNVNRALDEPIMFLGTLDGELSIKVYFDRDYRYHKYRLATARQPFAWVSTTAGSDGLHDVYLFNLGKYNHLQFISIEALFDNPYDLLNTPYFEQFSSSEFYAPSYVQKEVIDTLTQQYVNYYRQLHMSQRPNTQQA
jgi:hypothetical protein